MQPLLWEPKLIEFQHILTKEDYLARAPLPGYIDAIVFQLLSQNKRYPDKKSYPHLYHWYIIMRQFSINSIQNWITQRIYFDDHSEKLEKIFSEVIKDQTKSLLSPVKSLGSGFSLSRQNSLKGFQKIEQKNTNKNPQKLDFSFQKQQKKQNYVLMVHLRTIQNLQNLSQRLYQFKLKIKELRFDRNQKNVFLRFLSDKESCEQVKITIQSWKEVQKIICKKIITKPRIYFDLNQQYSFSKTTNFRS